MKAPPTDIEALKARVSALIHIKNLGIVLKDEEYQAIETYDEDLKKLEEQSAASNSANFLFRQTEVQQNKSRKPEGVSQKMS